ncbi:MAG: hypothetical protein J4F43_11145 [Dehalococcoidia bacterium]|nr:hypothetical protein [Dehalococcoidia bacterium]
MLRIGWFSTGRGPGSLGLLDHVQGLIAAGGLDARIEFVFTNREPGEAEGSDRFLRRVRDYGLPLVYHSSRRARRALGGPPSAHRYEYDRQVMSRLDGFGPDVCVLAGYMLIVGPEMCRRYTMLNLHPALPTGPVGAWQEVIWQLIEARSDTTGAMVHLVTEEVDRGPMVSYVSIPIKGPTFDAGWRELEGRSIARLKEDPGEDLTLFQLIRQEGYRREPHLLAATLDAIAKGRVRIEHGTVRDVSGARTDGLCLNDQVEGALAASSHRGDGPATG